MENICKYTAPTCQTPGLVCLLEALSRYKKECGLVGERGALPPNGVTNRMGDPPQKFEWRVFLRMRAIENIRGLAAAKHETTRKSTKTSHATAWGRRPSCCLLFCAPARVTPPSCRIICASFGASPGLLFAFLCASSSDAPKLSHGLFLGFFGVFGFVFPYSFISIARIATHTPSHA